MKQLLTKSGGSFLYPFTVTYVQAGKGRTGLMVSSYLVYTGMSAEKAMQVYAEKRTTNNEGVSFLGIFQ